MSKDHKARLTPPSQEPIYSVGYGKPPAETRFKPGRSGNPKGRPKGSRNKLPAFNEERLKAIVLEEAYRTIKVTEGRREVTITLAKAVVRALAVNAARGQVRSQQLFATLLSETERANKASHDAYLETAIQYKMGWEEELERRAEFGIVGLTEPLPHPEDISFDVRSGQVTIKGPMTKEEKAKWDQMWDRVEECDRAIAEVTADLKLRKNLKFKTFLEDEIAHEKRIRARIVGVIGEPRRRTPKPG